MNTQIPPDSQGEQPQNSPAGADAALHLVLAGSSNYADDGSRRAYGPEVFVAGPASRVVATRSTSPLTSISVILRPGMLHHFGALSAPALTDEFVTAQSAGLRGLEPLVHQLAEAWPHGALALVEEELRKVLRRCEGTSLDTPFPLTDSLCLMTLLREQRPRAVAAATGLSLRQIERNFQRQFGMSAKRYQRLSRFDRVLNLLRRRGLARGELADLALEVGYYDQSHLHNDFKAFAGFSPHALPDHASASGTSGSWLYRSTGQHLRPL